MKNITLSFLIFAIVFVSIGEAKSSIEKYRLTPSRRFGGLVDSTIYPVNLNKPEAAFLKTNSKHMHKDCFIDFDKKEVELLLYYGDETSKGLTTYKDSIIKGVVLSSYVFLELDDYLNFINQDQVNSDFKAGSPFFNMTEQQRKSFNPLDIQIPVKLPAWARRVVGSEGPRLTINGMFKITVGGNSHWITGAQDITNQKQGWPDISVNQEMNFTVTGKIGRLINVSISTDNTQDITDQLKKQMKILYKGETEDELEDEIIQEIEAGYTSFAMPGSEFDGYSENHEGLFGIKVRMKLGDLGLTAIVSQEDGQADKKTFNPSQQKTTTSLEDVEIAYNKVFFLDSSYYDDYYANPNKSTRPAITKIYLLKSDNYVQISNFINSRQKYPNNYLIGEGIHKRLIEMGTEEIGSDFYINRERGYIVLTNALQKDDRLLAYFETTDSTKSSSNKQMRYGYNDSTGGYSTIINIDTIYPYVLKPEAPKSTDATWKLSWKNVYEIGTISEENRNSITVKLFTRDPTNEQLWKETYVIGGKETRLSDFFKLTKVDGSPDIRNSQIYMFDYGILAFPQDLGPTPFRDSLKMPSELKKNPGIYNFLKEDHASNGVTSQYKLEVTAVSAKTSFSLGVINIMQGTDVVRMGSTVLKRDEDYLIDYEMGQVTLISDRARQSMGNIGVEYEYSPFFVPEQKTFMGLRAEYKLPGIGKESSISASFLRKSETSQDKRSQLGREPSTNMLVDVATKFSWEPEWMTNLVNKIPLIRTEQKSLLSVQAEYARSIVNPNTSDRDEALIDDYEDSKVLYTMQLSDAIWKWASPPDNSIIGPYSGLQCWGGNERGPGTPLPNVGWFAWYRRDTTEVSIWPGATNPQSRWPILEMDMHPHMSGSGGNASNNDLLRKGSWGGAMAPLGYGVKSQLENAQYIELWVRVVPGAKGAQRGFMHIDLGNISEDLRLGPANTKDTGITSIIITNTDPDKQFETEWFQLDKYYMAKETDMGLDMRDNPFERMLIPVDSGIQGRVSFQMVSYGQDPFGQGKTVTDPGGDNYSWPPSSADFKAYNGTQGNASGANYNQAKMNDPDDEDVFKINSSVDPQSVYSYRHYWIDLNQTSVSTAEPYLVGMDATTGWRHYKIPLLQPKKTGNNSLDSIPYMIGKPLLSEATGMRIWYDSLTEPVRFQIAKLEIVGNKWISTDTMKTVRNSVDTSSSSPPRAHLNVSVVNTIDDRGIGYTHPPFIPKYYDSEQQVNMREQALFLAYDSLTGINPEVKAVKFYQNGLDFRLYQDMKLYYKPVEMFKEGQTLTDRSGEVTFFLRFGLNDTNYYEFNIKPSGAGEWDSFSINLSDLSNLKNDQDLIGATGKAKKGQLAVLGHPTLAQIKWLALGFSVDSTRLENYQGKFYINDLKLTNPQKLGGNAARVKLTTDFADLITINTGMYYKDGSFLRLTDKWAGAGATEVSMDINTTMKMDKFTPAKLGLSLPVTAGIQSSIQRPMFVPESDVQLRQDELFEIAPDLFNLLAGRAAGQSTPGERYETTHLSRSVSSSYSKNTVSDNTLVNLTADRVKTSAGYSETDDMNTVRKRNAFNVTNNLTYSASPKKEMSVTPFKNSEKALLKNNISDMKIYYYPKSLEFKVYDAQYSNSEEYSRTKLKTSSKPLVNSSLGMSHSYDLNLSPVLEWKYLTIGFTHNNAVSRNFSDVVNDPSIGNSDLLTKYILATDDKITLDNGTIFPDKFILYGETNNSQAFNYDITPVFVKWLTHTFNYRSNYSHNIHSANSQKGIGTTFDYMDLSSSTAFTTNVNWMFVDMMDWSSGLIKKDVNSGPFKKVKDVFNYFGFTKIGVNYDVNVDRKVSNLTHIPLSPSQFLAFKSGLYGLTPASLFTGDDDEKLFGGWKYQGGSGVYAIEKGVSSTDGRNVKIGAGTNAGITLPFLLRMNLNSNLKYSKSFNEVRGYVTVDTMETWPSYTVTGSISDFMPVMKYAPIIGKLISTSSVNSGFTYEKGRNRKYDNYNTAKNWQELRFKYAFSPVLKLGMNLKNNIRLDNSTDWSLDRNYGTQNPSTIKGIESYRVSNKTTANYTIDKHRTIKLIFWDLTLNNQLQLFTSYDYAMDWSYQWDVRVGGQLVESVSEYEKESKTTLNHTKKTKNYNYSAGASYDITAKMKAGANFSWKKTLDVKPGKSDSDVDNRPEYDINVQTWVSWNF